MKTKCENRLCILTSANIQFSRSLRRVILRQVREKLSVTNCTWNHVIFYVSWLNNFCLKSRNCRWDFTIFIYIGLFQNTVRAAFLEFGITGMVKSSTTLSSSDGIRRAQIDDHVKQRRVLDFSFLVLCRSLL